MELLLQTQDKRTKHKSSITLWCSTRSHWNCYGPKSKDETSFYLNGFSNIKHCTINAPAESANLIINSDVCYDMTSAFEGQFGSIPGMTITPPITMAIKNTVTSQTVADCFATDASSISDTFTNEVWVKQNGSFVKVNN